MAKKTTPPAPRLVDQVMAPPQPKGQPVPRRRWLRLRSGRTPVVAGTVLCVGVLAWQYIHARQQIKQLTHAQSAVKQEAISVRDKVAQIAEVPADETPTVATITDTSKLKGQAFFQDAHQGDKVVIFTKAKRAVLYRPSTNKIVEMSPLDLSSSGSSP